MAFVTLENFSHLVSQSIFEKLEIIKDQDFFMIFCKSIFCYYCLAILIVVCIHVSVVNISSNGSDVCCLIVLAIKIFVPIYESLIYFYCM